MKPVSIIAISTNQESSSTYDYVRFIPLSWFLYVFGLFQLFGPDHKREDPYIIVLKYMGGQKIFKKHT